MVVGLKLWQCMLQQQGVCEYCCVYRGALNRLVRLRLWKEAHSFLVLLWMRLLLHSIASMIHSWHSDRRHSLLRNSRQESNSMLYSDLRQQSSHARL